MMHINTYKKHIIKIACSLCIILYTHILMAQTTATSSQCDTLYMHYDTENSFDATVHSLYPNTNFGTDENTLASAWTINAQFVTLRAYFNFALPQLPLGSVINNATVYFKYNPNTTISQGNSYYPGSPYFDLNDGGIYRIEQAWAPSTITWNNQPSYSNLNNVWVPFSTAQTQDLQVDITPLVNDSYLYPAISHGFVFKMMSETIYRCQVYASSNHPNPALHPKLVICYTTTSSNATNDVAKELGVKIDCIPQGGIRISNPSHTMLNEVCIYALDGSLIERIRLNNREEQKTVQVTRALANGLYVVRLQTEKGSVCSKMPVW